MKRMLQKIFLLVAVVTVTGHNILPHFHHDETPFITNQQHHHEEQPGEKHHHDDESKDQEHGLFVFAQLDDNYIPAKKKYQYIELPVEFIPLLTAIVLDCSKATTKTHYGWYREYPPPDNYYHILSLRGPPVA